MTKRIKFHLDENVDPVIATALKRYGIDVTTTPEAGLRMASDDEQVLFAFNEQRVIVTHDADFLRIANRHSNHFGIAYCHKESRSVGEMIRTLQLIYEVLEVDDLYGRVEYL